jgi:hypothetical protein
MVKPQQLQLLSLAAPVNTTMLEAALLVLPVTGQTSQLQLHAMFVPSTTTVLLVRLLRSRVQTALSQMALVQHPHLRALLIPQQQPQLLHPRPPLPTLALLDCISIQAPQLVLRVPSITTAPPQAQLLLLVPVERTQAAPVQHPILHATWFALPDGT